jgi:hypothetical protein
MPDTYRQPILLSGLDINPSSLPFNSNVLLTPLDGGFNSYAYRIGSQVIKVSKACGPAEMTDKLLRTMQREHDTMAAFIGDNMPETIYSIAGTRDDPGIFRIVTLQDFVEGTVLPKYITRPDAEADQLIDFLKRCLRMHDETYLIPDLANIQTGFNIFRNTNVVIEKIPGHPARPILTDTNFGKKQRSSTFGSVWTWAIAVGVRRGLYKLERKGD